MDRSRSSLIRNWRYNSRGETDLEVTYRGQRQLARATLVDDPDLIASVCEAQLVDLGSAVAQRRLGVRINVNRLPTHQEWVEVIRREGVSIVRIELRR